MKIKTEQLKGLVSKASIGVGGNKLIPITELIGIRAVAGVFELITTDATNYVYVQQQIESTKENDIEATIHAEQFVRLVGKLTSEYTELRIENDNLVVVANGVYTLELPLDENGTPIIYPDPLRDVVFDVMPYEVDVEDVKKIIQIAKSSLATTVDRPALINYYVGKSVFATDGCLVTEFRKELFEQPQLVSPKLMDILGAFDEKKLNVTVTDEFICCKSDGMAVYGKLSDDVNEYEIQGVEQYIGTKFPNVCKVNKEDLLSAIDRISLFVSKYDNKAIRMMFDTDGIVISNLKSGSTESVSYIEKKSNVEKKVTAFEAYINADMVSTQLKSYVGDIVSIEYGVDFAISLVSEDTTQIISLMEV